MVSDTLSDAVHEIKGYLNDGYSNEAEINKAVVVMEAVRTLLDAGAYSPMQDSTRAHLDPYFMNRFDKMRILTDDPRRELLALDMSGLVRATEALTDQTKFHK